MRLCFVFVALSVLAPAASFAQVPKLPPPPIPEVVPPKPAVPKAVPAWKKALAASNTAQAVVNQDIYNVLGDHEGRIRGLEVGMAVQGNDIAWLKAHAFRPQQPVVVPMPIPAPAYLPSPPPPPPSASTPVTVNVRVRSSSSSGGPAVFNSFERVYLPAPVRTFVWCKDTCQWVLR